MTLLDALIERFADRWHIRLEVMGKNWIVIHASHQVTGKPVDVSMQTVDDAARCMLELLEFNENGRWKIKGQ